MREFAWIKNEMLPKYEIFQQIPHPQTKKNGKRVTNQQWNHKFSIDQNFAANPNNNNNSNNYSNTCIW